jgi:putative ABC transport system permease protein
MRESTSVAAIAPLLRSGVQLVYGDKNWNTSIYGTTLPYFQVRDWKVVKGTAWEPHDEATKAKVIVLGSSVATKLFGTEDPIGRSIRVGRYPFRVLGVLDSKGEAPFSGDQDDCVIIPIGSYRSRVQHTPPGFAGILLASATSTETTSGAVKQMESILRQRHHIEEGRDEDFEIHSQKEFADMQEDILGMLSAMLIGVAAVSLLVGGIGVMNIMLVNVTERTREIGIRMAIGARAGDIRAQFLVEAVSLALLGGLAGAALGFAGTSFAAKMIGWTVPFDVRPLALALGVSGGIGVGFGFFPARRAAQLDPIDALRHE